MAGTLYWHGGLRSIEIPAGGCPVYVPVYGIDVEVKVEEEGLRLTYEDVRDTRKKEKREAVLNHFNEIRYRRKELAAVTLELRQTFDKLIDVENNDVDDLVDLVRNGKAIMTRHATKLEELEAMSTASVGYKITTAGATVVLPPSRYMAVDFLEYPLPLCWCPADTAPPMCVSKKLNETKEVVKMEPLCGSGAAAKQTFATGKYGLEVAGPDCDLIPGFEITTRDSNGRLCDKGGEIFCIEVNGKEVPQDWYDRGNGEYDVDYSVPWCDLGDAKEFSLSVFLHGEHITDSPFQVKREKYRPTPPPSPRSPTSPAWSPTSPTYSPTSPSYNP